MISQETFFFVEWHFTELTSFFTQYLKRKSPKSTSKTPDRSEGICFIPEFPVKGPKVGDSSDFTHIPPHPPDFKYHYCHIRSMTHYKYKWMHSFFCLFLITESSLSDPLALKISETSEKLSPTN